MRKVFMGIIIGTTLLGLGGCSQKEEVTKTAKDIEYSTIGENVINKITLDDDSVIEVKTKYKIVRQEELNQFITVKNDLVKYIIIPSYR